MEKPIIYIVFYNNYHQLIGPKHNKRHLYEKFSRRKIQDM